MNNQEQNNKNQSQPMMAYGEQSNHLYTDVDDITRPIQENNGAPTVNAVPDPYLSGYVDDWEQPIEEVSEVDGRPSLPTLKDPRRLS